MWKNRDEYLKQDINGRWINTEYPPDSFIPYPNNSGYKDANAEMLFYEFAVQYYDLRIKYQGNEYLAIVDDDGAYIADPLYYRISDIYPTANDLATLLNYRNVRAETSEIRRLLQIYWHLKPASNSLTYRLYSMGIPPAKYTAKTSVGRYYTVTKDFILNLSLF